MSLAESSFEGTGRPARAGRGGGMAGHRMGMKRWAVGTRLARLQEYRAGDAQLRLLTPDGKAPKKGTHITIVVNEAAHFARERTLRTPKPADDALVKLIKGRWWTRAEPRVSRQGTAQFHGFYGDYKVRVPEDGQKLIGTFTFNTQTAQPLEVKLHAAN